MDKKRENLAVQGRKEKLEAQPLSQEELEELQEPLNNEEESPEEVADQVEKERQTLDETFSELGRQQELRLREKALTMTLREKAAMVESLQKQLEDAQESGQETLVDRFQSLIDFWQRNIDVSQKIAYFRRRMKKEGSRWERFNW